MIWLCLPLYSAELGYGAVLPILPALLARLPGPAAQQGLSLHAGAADRALHRLVRVRRARMGPDHRPVRPARRHGGGPSRLRLCHRVLRLCGLAGRDVCGTFCRKSVRRCSRAGHLGADCEVLLRQSTRSEKTGISSGPSSARSRPASCRASSPPGACTRSTSTPASSMCCCGSDSTPLLLVAEPTPAAVEAALRRQLVALSFAYPHRLGQTSQAYRLPRGGH